MHARKEIGETEKEKGETRRLTRGPPGKWPSYGGGCTDMRKRTSERVRVGVFNTVGEADLAVRLLLGAGFTKEKISVVCSDEMKERHFSEFRHDEPAGTKTPKTAAAGGIAGGIAGGLVGVATVATGMPEAILLEGLFAGAGATFGTFVGAMMSRGMEREVANYYDQALRRGQLLVAAEVDPDGDETMLDRAERVFEDVGARAESLPAG
jgi:hypothetical protein